MKIFLSMVGFMLMALVVAFTWYNSPLNQVKGEYRYKITVNVQTPDGVKSGSAVRVVKDADLKYKIFKGLPESTSPARIHGEAVVIDLGEKGELFGLIDWNTKKELFTAFPISGPSTLEGIKYYNNLPIGESRELNVKHAWPDFVMFEDLSDPMSVKAVNKENISEQLGEGYSIQNIEIEITDEPITWKMHKFFGKRKAIGPYTFVRGER